MKNSLEAVQMRSHPGKHIGRTKENHAKRMSKKAWVAVQIRGGQKGHKCSLFSQSGSTDINFCQTHYVVVS